MGKSTYPGPCGAEDGDAGSVDTTPGPICRTDNWFDQYWIDNSDTPGPIGTDDRAEAEPYLCAPPDTVEAEPGYTPYTLTPAEFMRQYLYLSVPYFDPNTGERRTAYAKIHLYTNLGAGHANRHSNLKEKDDLNGLVRSAVKRGQPKTPVAPDGAHRGRISKAFYGKGLPNDYTLALMYAIAFQRTTVASLQDYVYNNAILGMDCTGFVNNYLRQINVIEKDRTIPTHLQKGKKNNLLREEPSKIKPRDILIWNKSDGKASQHIAIIDTVSNGGNKLLVVESSGTGPKVANGNIGLGSSEYTIVKPIKNTPGAYRVNRGAYRNNGHSDVFILGVPSD